jgi:hypothetical protein
LKPDPDRLWAGAGAAIEFRKAIRFKLRVQRLEACGEASNSLRRAIFFHRQGEIRDRTFENQSFRASGLSLVTAAIVHWNTVYLDRAVQHLRAQDVTIRDDLLAHVAPLGWEHIALTGDYIWNDRNVAPGFRSLRHVSQAFLSQAA